MSGLIKICGIREPSHGQAAAASGATHIGFNHVKRSPRFVDLETARSLRGFATRDTVRVAVFADADDMAISAFCAAIGANAVQLHGTETPERVVAVKRLTGLPAIKAFGVSSPDDLAGLSPYTEIADVFLLDAKPPKGADRTGGHGASFDWSILAGWHSPRPWFLSGGLDPLTVSAAIAATGAPGVDVASGVEEPKGVKSPALIRQFCQTAASAFLSLRSSAA